MIKTVSTLEQVKALNTRIFDSILFNHIDFGIIEAVEEHIFIRCKFVGCSCDLEHGWSVIFDSCCFEACEIKNVHYPTTCIFSSFNDCKISGFSISSLFLSNTAFYHTKFDHISLAELCTASNVSLKGVSEIDSCTFDRIKPVSLHISQDTKFINTKFSPVPQYCGEKGTSIIGYKVVFTDDLFDDYCALATLLIPKDAERVMSINGKCRCDKAKVLSLEYIDDGKTGKPPINYGISPFAIKTSNYVRYIVGEMAIPNGYNPNPIVECGKGIHFFLTKEEALRFAKEKL